MQLSCINPNSKTFSIILTACSTREALEKVMNIRKRVVKNGFALNVMVMNYLIGMYIIGMEVTLRGG